MGWIIKMLLKVMKPFVKVMIWQAIFDYLGDLELEDETEPATDEVTTDEPAE